MNSILKLLILLGIVNLCYCGVKPENKYKGAKDAIEARGNQEAVRQMVNATKIRPNSNIPGRRMRSLNGSRREM